MFIDKWNVKDSPMCGLCKNPSQNSTHRFFSCPRILPVWDHLTEITRNTSIEHAFSETCAILNVFNVPKDHPLITLTNYTRKLIESAQCSEVQIHPNTMLYKILHMSEIFAHNDTKFNSIWSEIANKSKNMIKPFNPQILWRTLDVNLIIDLIQWLISRCDLLWTPSHLRPDPWRPTKTLKTQPTTASPPLNPWKA